MLTPWAAAAGELGHEHAKLDVRTPRVPPALIAPLLIAAVQQLVRIEILPFGKIGSIELAGIEIAAVQHREPPCGQRAEAQRLLLLQRVGLGNLPDIEAGEVAAEQI